MNVFLEMAGDIVLILLSTIFRIVSVQGEWFLTRPEISTPLNSWLRLTEGVHMFNKGLFKLIKVNN